MGTAVPAAAAPSATQQDLDDLVAALKAQKAKIAEQERRLKEQASQLDQQKQSLRQQQEQLDALRTRIEQGLAAAPAAAPALLPNRLLGVLRGTGTGGAQTAQSAAPEQQVGAPPSPAEHPPEVTVLSDRGGVLTPHGTLVYEPSIDFAHATDNRAIISGFTVLPAITVGQIDVGKVNHDTWTAANTLRYGVTNRLELETRVPYVWRRDETTSRPIGTGSSSDTTTTVGGSDLGDIELAGHYQINSGANGWPYFIGNLRFKTMTGSDPFKMPLDSAGLPARLATGSGFYNVEPSLTVIYPSDPAVFFANVGYLFGIDRHVDSPLVGGPATVDPGSAIRFSFGLGFGINEASSFSLGYDYSSFTSTRVNGVTQPGTDLQVGSVLIGYSYRFNDWTSLNLTTGIGVTSDAPGTRIIARVPIRFQIFK